MHEEDLPHAPPLRGSLPPRGALSSWGGPAMKKTPGLVRSFALYGSDEAAPAWTELVHLEHIPERSSLFDWEIDLHVELGSLGDEVTAARQATAKAAAASQAAAQQTRRVVQRLRASGLSVTDSAAILGVSRGRISQLASKAR